MWLGLGGLGWGRGDGDEAGYLLEERAEGVFHVGCYLWVVGDGVVE